MTNNTVNYPNTLNASPDPVPKRKLWMAAIKPPMYSVAVMPILLGAGDRLCRNSDDSLGSFLNVFSLCDFNSCLGEFA